MLRIDIILGGSICDANEIQRSKWKAFGIYREFFQVTEEGININEWSLKMTGETERIIGKVELTQRVLYSFAQIDRMKKEANFPNASN